MIRSQLKFGSSSVWAMCDCCDVYNVLTLLSWRLWMNFFGHPPAPLHPPPGVISFLFNNLTLLSLSLWTWERGCVGVRYDLCTGIAKRRCTVLDANLAERHVGNFILERVWISLGSRKNIGRRVAPNPSPPCM